jgi:predicted metal-dependent phosphotriesterase family hydrolase
MKSYGGYGYDHFLRVIVSELRRRGLDETTLQTILADNPRRFLEGRAYD